MKEVVATGIASSIVLLLRYVLCLVRSVLLASFRFVSDGTDDDRPFPQKFQMWKTALGNNALSDNIMYSLRVCTPTRRTLLLLLLLLLLL
jgi:hypothetical protein